jgi:uncharacterized protein (UPF0261 family)
VGRTQGSRKTIVIVATLDTRGDEVEYLKKIFGEKGHETITIDTGVMGTPYFAGDYMREDVAKSGGKSLKELVGAADAGADRKAATDVMIAGAKVIVNKLHAEGKLHGIMSLGGTTGASSGVAVMQGLPIGLPKFIITTFTALTPIGDEDITVMQSPVDLVGLNKIIMKTLSNAAGALMGMVEQETQEKESRKLAGITALGVTTPAVQKTMALLDKRGYDSLVFHALTAKLDRMVKDGIIDAVIDITSFELIPKTCYSDDLLAKYSGMPNPDRSRLRSAVERGIPQIIAPGGLDMHIIPGATKIDEVPDMLKGRAWTMHGPNVVLVRTSAEELEKAASSIAEQANSSRGPVAVLIPINGFSDASKKDAPLFDPESDSAFVRAVRKQVSSKVRLREIDCHINDDAFADELVKLFDEMMKK